ncbi:unnamed protein product [Parnassius apollo]|uniref:(apollo) hypothetical protein n=1 Tax=Parnassius apollo TaxID=110799 RepID=A0A8S3Y0R3_PARAO|nr:unnamed protein product [Parnassius apollo]
MGGIKASFHDETEDKCFMAAKLYDIMKCRAYHAYFTFLDVHLRQVTKVNCLFQSDNVDPTKLLEDLFLLFKNILQIIVIPRKLEIVTDGEYASFGFQEHLMHVSAMHFGYTVEEALSKLDRRDKEDTWKDSKKGARIENAAAARGRSTTGNVATVPTVSEMGTKVLNIIGYKSSTGIGPEESSISQANVCSYLVLKLCFV